MTSYNSSDASSRQDFFFRVADRLRMESCAHSLTAEGKSLMLYCPSSSLLSHYGGQLISRLRELAPRSSIEIFFPSNSEALVSRFNEVLANLSIDKATQSPASGMPDKIWVVHDANALTENELQLLTRLLQHFPGANVCAVLMLSGKTHPMPSLDTQNRRIVRWDMEVPSIEQAQQTLQQATTEESRQAIQLLIEKMQLSSPPDLSELKVDIDPDVRHWEDDEEEQSSTKRKSGFLKWTLGLVLMLCLSVGITAWLQPQAFSDLATQAVELVFPPRKAPRAETPEPAQAPASTPTPTPTQTPAPAASASETPAASEAAAASAAATTSATPTTPATPSTPATPATPATTAAATAAAPSTGATPAMPATPATGAANKPAAATNSGTTAATTAAATATPAKPAPATPATTTPSAAATAKPEAAVKEADIVTELPDIAVKGQQWLAGLPKDTFVVIHAAYTTSGAAQKLIKNQSWLNQARIVPYFKSPKDPAEFLVVTGPFRSEERAKGYITRLEIPASTRIEAVSKLLPSTRIGDEKSQKTTKVRKP